MRRQNLSLYCALETRFEKWKTISPSNVVSSLCHWKMTKEIWNLNTITKAAHAMLVYCPKSKKLLHMYTRTAGLLLECINVFPILSWFSIEDPNPSQFLDRQLIPNIPGLWSSVMCVHGYGLWHTRDQSANEYSCLSTTLYWTMDVFLWYRTTQFWMQLDANWWTIMQYLEAPFYHWWAQWSIVWQN